MQVISSNGSLGEIYGPAMELETQEEADAYFEQLVGHRLRRDAVDREAAETIERNNLAYYAGYCSHETRLRVEKLFSCTHPVLGARLS